MLRSFLTCKVLKDSGVALRTTNEFKGGGEKISHMRAETSSLFDDMTQRATGSIRRGKVVADQEQ